LGRAKDLLREKDIDLLRAKTEVQTLNPKP
jgi:hypothetical protein